MLIDKSQLQKTSNTRFNDFMNGLESPKYECLVKKTMLSSIKDFSSSIPQFLTSLLEIRLDDKYSEVDFEICCSPYVFIPKNFVSKTFSDKLSSFCSEWNSPNSILRLAGDFWLEFDAKNDLSIYKVPSIFVNLPLEDRQDSITLAQSFIRNFGRIHEKKYINLLEIYSNILPKSASIRYMGFLYSRPGQPLRIAIKDEGKSLHSQLEYLAQIGWLAEQPIIRSFVCDQLAPIVKHSKDHNISFDFNQDGIFPRIGLDISLHEPTNTSPNWEAILQYLVDKKLCSKQKKEALCDWSKSNKDIKLLNRRKNNFMRNIICKPLKYSGVFYPRIEHIKLVFDLPDIIEAKVYLFSGYS